MAKPLRAVRVYGEGARQVKRYGSLMVYRKWVRAPEDIEHGELVVVEDESGEVIACGFYDEWGPVALRLIGLGYCSYSTPEEAIRARLEEAYNTRKRLGYTEKGFGYRLVHSDGDLMPGLIVDVYDDLVVFQSSSKVWDKYRSTIVEALREILEPRSIYEKSTQRTRLEIGLEPYEKLHYGDKPRAIVYENDVKLLVDPVRGQKTGLFLDQRDNRLLFSSLVDAEARVLDVFSYTGGFGLQALARGAREVVFIEQDEKAVKILEENLELNKVDKSKVRIINDDAWHALRRLIGFKERFNVVVVDPPAFIPRAEVKDRGVRGYQNIYRMALRCLRREGLLFLSSCSSFLSRSEFLEIVAQSLQGSDYRLIGGVRGMPLDHPSRPSAPYLDYLKSLFIRVYTHPYR